MLDINRPVGNEQKYIDLAEKLGLEYNNDFIIDVNSGELDDWIDSSWWEDSDG